MKHASACWLGLTSNALRQAEKAEKQKKKQGRAQRELHKCMVKSYSSRRLSLRRPSDSEVRNDRMRALKLR